MAAKADPKEVEFAVHCYSVNRKSISSIADVLNRSRSTVRHWLREAGVYDDQQVFNNCTISERQLLTHLSSKGLNTVEDFQKFEFNLSLDQQLLNTAPKDWGYYLYKAAVHRNYIIAEYNHLQSIKDAENKV